LKDFVDSQSLLGNETAKLDVNLPHGLNTYLTDALLGHKELQPEVV
jgi:hypothetical protein